MSYSIITLLVYKMLCATLVGAIIGLEREINKKSAGLKTFVLISCGAALFTYMSLLLGVKDPARIAAQVVSGVGFLGAGVIFKGSDGVEGITTAAFIWVVAALGMLVGLGFILESVLLSIGMVIAILILAVFEKFLRRLVNGKS